MRIRSKYLDEKLTAADPTSKWISDFVASDNPRFANKSIKERINMALGASYAAKGQSANEETVRDPVMAFASKAHEEWRSGWRKQNNGNSLPRVKNNSDGSEGDINVPFNKLHPDWQKENLAAGNAAKDAVTKHPNDIEKAAEHVHNKWMERNPKQDYNAAQHVPYSELPEDEKEKDRVHVRTMQNLMSTNEEIQDSGWNPAKKRKDQYGNPIKPHNVPKRLARQGIPKQPVKDEKGFGPSPADKLSIRKNEEVEELDEISKDALTSYADKSIKDAETRRKQGNAYEKLVPSDPDYAKTFYKKSANRLAGATKAMSRLAKEEVELDEGKYGAFRIGPKRPKYPHVPPGNQDPRTGLPLGFSPPPNKDEPKDKKVKEEVELDEDNKAYQAQDKASRETTGMSLQQRSKMYDAIQKELNDQEKEYRKQGILPPKSTNEGIGKTIGRVAGQYAGSKLGMEGPGAAGGELLGHHIEYHAREFAKKLHAVIKKHLSGNPAPQNSSFEHDEDSNLINELDEPTLTRFATRARFSSNPKHREASRQAMEKIKKKKQQTNNEEVEQVDEVLDTPSKALGYIAKATISGLTSGALNTGNGEFRKRQTGIQTAIRKTKEKIAKMSNEEVELEEDGKLKGGAKDPCWKGYQMVGTKKKNGREVPNCVPREGKEYKSFKALREELNGDSNRS
jgi:hypothetical protein